MSNLELVQASGLKPVVTALRQRGIDAAPYLERNGIPREFLELPYAPVPKRRRLWAFLEDVATSENLPTLGFLLGDTMDLTEAGPYAAWMCRAETLRAAFDILDHNIANIAQSNTLKLEEEGGLVWVCIESWRKDCVPADHLTVMYLISIIRLATGPAWRPPAIRLQTGAQEAIRELPLLRDTEITFDAPHAAVAVEPGVLDLPLPGYDPTSAESPVELPPLPATGKLSDSLRVVIAGLLAYEGPPTADQAAELVGVSRATLFRRLTREGTSYRRLTDEVRVARAKDYLADPRLNVKDISYLLGYSNPNNFVRAFRQSAGTTPTRFRDETLSA